MKRCLAAFLILVLYLIRLSCQQDTNVCPIGYNYFNGKCVNSVCPETHYLVGGACLLKPTGIESCSYGFDLINGMCVQQNCPVNFIMVNGLCQQQFNNQPPLYCPNGFSVHNEMCFPNPGIITPAFCQPKPCHTAYCPFICERPINMHPIAPTTSSPITTTTATTTTTTTTTAAPCASEHVLIDGECRFVYCLKGSFYRGRCLEPVCSDGLVWTGLTCTYPEVITTVLEIENNFINDTNITGPDLHASKPVNNIIYVNETESNANLTDSCITTNTKCCTIITPRMCKKYNLKWVCFNRQYRQCGEVCGAYSIKYLKIPKVIESSGMIVIPPNPSLQNCIGTECSNSDFVDCSGCLTYQKQSCSPYCYRYRCPNNRCTFVDQSEYCTKYGYSPGCNRFDGCFEDYCNTGNESPKGCV